MKNIAMAVVIKGQSVLVQKRFRSSIGMVYEFPGGSMDAGETPEQAARRELMEETNINLNESYECYEYTNDFGGSVFFVIFRAENKTVPKVTVSERKQTFHWFSHSDIPVNDFKSADSEFISKELKELLINKTNFFDQHAHKWDSYQDEDTFQKIEIILSRAKLSENDSILDVGAGTGVLLPFLHKTGVKNTIAVDSSINMVKVYKQKFPDHSIIVGDYQTTLFSNLSFEKIIIFNTFPHFDNVEAVFENSFKYLKNNGKLVIAHSMNREALNEHHRAAGKAVENDVLISDDSFRKLYIDTGFKKIVVENSDYFYSEGIKA